MYCKFTLEGFEGYWTFVMTLDSNTPSALEEANQYADDHHSAEDIHGIRHYVLLKQEKIVQIQLHHALQILPHFSPDDPSSLQMPALQAIMFGNPPVPTLLIVFKEFNPQKLTAFGLGPHVYLVFDDVAHLARLYITDVYKVLNDPD